MLHNHSIVIFTDSPLEFKLEQPNAELHSFAYEQIGIDEVRALITEAHRRPSEQGVEKRIVITANKMTSEAQQAALKILEEPPELVGITLVLPIGTQLLPTIISRVQIETKTQSAHSDIFDAWQKLSVGERLQEVDVKLKAKDLGWQQELKAGLQKHVSAPQGYSSEVLVQLNQVVEELLTRGASNKMLLEHLALSLPLTAGAGK